MPLNLSNRDQNSGHLFYNRRLRAALTRCSVRMTHDDRKQQAALVMSLVLSLLGCAWMALLAAIKPAGVVGQAEIVGNRDTGALYARVDGRLHPALNLTSARLVTGSPGTPRWINAGEIAKYPTGPMIGMPGIPDDFGMSPNPLSAWTICDSVSAREAVTVTAIAGELPAAGRSEPMQESQAILGVHDHAHYLIRNGHRTPVDIADRAVTFTLGLDPATTRPVPMSNALFDAMPATEPLTVPRIPEAGAPSRILPGATVGRILVTHDVTGAATGFYVLLSEGLQPITALFAELLRAADRNLPAPQAVSPATVLAIPEVRVLDVDAFPSAKPRFIDTAVNPVTCLAWTKRTGDPRATLVLLTGRGLPSPETLDSHIVSLVRDRRDPGSVEAQQVLVLPGAANLVVSTGAAPGADTREALFWVSPQGVRYGIEQDPETLHALGLDPDRAVQAPWTALRTLAAGPAISRTNALIARDAITQGVG